jgi:hypothetical protein
LCGLLELLLLGLDAFVCWLPRMRYELFLPVVRHGGAGGTVHSSGRRGRGICSEAAGQGLFDATITFASSWLVGVIIGGAAGAMGHRAQHLHLSQHDLELRIARALRRNGTTVIGAGKRCAAGAW